MAEQFTVDVEHNGKHYSFEGELKQLGYTHKIFLQVNLVEVVFEPDEERNYRVIIANPKEAERFDKRLLQAIVNELQLIMFP